MARLVTGWHVDTRVLGVGLPAMGLHAWSISYCDHALSDGFIPAGAWPSLAGAGAAVKALLDAGLWTRTEGGFRLHNYLKYNRSKAQVDAYMAAKVAAGQAGGQASAQARARPPAQANGNQTGKQTLKQNSTPNPGPGPVGSPDPPKPPLPTADAQGATPTRPLAEPPEPAIIHAEAGICPFCRLPYTGSYLDHTSSRHAVKAEPAAPGNLGPALSHKRRAKPADAPPPEIAAQFAAMHERLQSMPGAS